MQFSIVKSALAVFAFASIAAACNPGQDCCWGGEAGGWKGCMNQHNNLFIEDRDARCQQLKNDWCSNQGVTEAQCDADCCAISTGWGKACP